MPMDCLRELVNRQSNPNLCQDGQTKWPSLYPTQVQRRRESTWATLICTSVFAGSTLSSPHKGAQARGRG